MCVWGEEEASRGPFSCGGLSLFHVCDEFAANSKDIARRRAGTGSWESSLERMGRDDGDRVRAEWY